MLLDSDLEEKFKHDDQFSETEDELFYENRTIIDTKLEDLGVYNQYIRIW